jgi:hypothetical protein
MQWIARAALHAWIHKPSIQDATEHVQSDVESEDALTKNTTFNLNTDISLITHPISV